MVGNDISEWNFSSEYAKLWKQDEEKMSEAIQRGEFSVAGNILLAAMTRYPQWALQKAGKDFDPITLYEDFMQEVMKYNELLSYEAPGFERQLLQSEIKLNKKLGAARMILHEMLDNAGILLRKTRETDEEDDEDLVKRYAAGR